MGGPFRGSGMPCCGARKNVRAFALLHFFDRCHSLSSLYPPPAAVASLPTGTPFTAAPLQIHHSRIPKQKRSGHFKGQPARSIGIGQRYHLFFRNYNRLIEPRCFGEHPYHFATSVCHKQVCHFLSAGGSVFAFKFAHLQGILVINDILD